MKEKNLQFICKECGEQLYNKTTGVATWHMQICDNCNKWKVTTEPRDFTEEINRGGEFKMTEERMQVEIDGKDPTKIIVNGKRFAVNKYQTNKKDGIEHVDRYVLKEVKEEELAEDKKVIINALKKRTNVEELLDELIKSINPRILKRLANRIRDKKPIKVHHGCLGFKIGDVYLNLIADYPNRG